MEQDRVDEFIAEWRRERPDLDPAPMGIIGRIGRLSRMLDAALLDVFNAYSVTSGEFEVLTALRRAGVPYQLSPTELSRAMLLSPGAVTNRLDRLEQAGLVRRTNDPADRRSTIVMLTQQGVVLIEEAIGAHFANEHRLLESLTAAEQAQLVVLLRKLLLSFERDEPHSV